MAAGKEVGKGPWQHYFTIGAGVCIMALAFFHEGLGALEVVKLLVGAGLVGYGIWKLLQGKRSS